MDRRLFLGGAVLGVGALTGGAFSPVLRAASADRAGWRSFELVTRVRPAIPGASVWVPMVSIGATDWQRLIGSSWDGNAASVKTFVDPVYGARGLYATWDRSEAIPELDLITRFQTRDRVVDLSGRGERHALSDDERALYTSATKLLPTDGIVRETADAITQDLDSDLEKARAIYDWVVENTVRDPKVQGCGVGDIRFMLESGNLSGKCADLNALYVGLCRASGLPARDVYGVRIADSRLGYRSLGKSGNVSKAQHCRAEVWLEAYGWVPVDPADVRKVLLEEQPGLTLTDPKVVAARDFLFGGWEMNWVAYNYAHDLSLPGSQRSPLPYLMYPEGEVNGKRFNGLDPANFEYELISRSLDLS